MRPNYWYKMSLKSLIKLPWMYNNQTCMHAQLLAKPQYMALFQPQKSLGYVCMCLEIFAGEHVYLCALT